MDPSQQATSWSTEPVPQPTAHRRGPSGSGGFLGRLPFMKSSLEASTELGPQPAQQGDGAQSSSSSSSSLPLAGGTSGDTVVTQRTRRRRGSLRKVALLGRGAQRSRRGTSPSSPAAKDSETNETPRAADQYDALGLGSVDLTPRASIAARRSAANAATAGHTIDASTPATAPESSATYNSTTDEDDMLQFPQQGPRRLSQPAPGPYVGMEMASVQRRRSFHQAKSPLSYNGLASTPGQADSDWDYSDTEWWGWVVLIVTWLVFVIGMGSCLDVWSWAWDIGKTPYAPPELEDDPTLPIVGYYPCLIILTCVMAWVWVVVAWVGMKYFRHAKISGD